MEGNLTPLYLTVMNQSFKYVSKSSILLKYLLVLRITFEKRELFYISIKVQQIISELQVFDLRIVRSNNLTNNTYDRFKNLVVRSIWTSLVILMFNWEYFF